MEETVPDEHIVRKGRRQFSSGLLRDIDLIEALATSEVWEKGGLTVSEVVQITNRDKAQVSRALRTLWGVGLVDRDRSTRRYRIGSRFYEIASHTQEAYLVMASQRFLLDAVSLTQQSAQMSVLRGGLIHTLRTEESSSSRGEESWQGKRFWALDTAAGRAILSTFSDRELKAWFAEHQLDPLEYDAEVEPASDSARVATFRELKKALAGIFERGYAIMADNYEPNMIYAASPVRDGQGRVVAAISVGMPKKRLGTNYSSLGLVTARVAQDFSRELGGSLFPRDASVPTDTSEIPVIFTPNSA